MFTLKMSMLIERSRDSRRMYYLCKENHLFMGKYSTYFRGRSSRFYRSDDILITVIWRGDML